jgi:arylsulfatase A-like enzyme
MAFGAVLLTAALVIAAIRVALYRQSDDIERLEHKREYLAGISSMADGGAAGPNVVFILFDDLGAGDLGAYGGRAIATPNLDRLASEGLVFSDGYSPSPYCSASRAGWLTGRYAVRSGMDHVIQVPGSWQDTLIRFGGLNRRLPAEEITLAEVLQAAGYATAIIGKWHLGDGSPSLPTEMGFDSFFGLLYSNDQGEPQVWEDRRVVEPHPIDQSTLTRRYTERAVSFIEEHADMPFFLYLPHTFPHIPLFVGEDRSGRSSAGLYGDVVEELDWSTGRILAALKRAGVERKTLVIVSSDNGPWFQGSPGGARGRKFDIFEGGMRVPFLARWPGTIRPGSVDREVAVGVDLFPTILEAAGLPAPDDRVIDGESLLRRFTGSPGPAHGPVWFHQIRKLRAVRDGRFKYHDRHGVAHGNPPDFPLAIHLGRGPWLFDLTVDRDESYDVSGRYPEEFERLAALFDARREELVSNPRGWLSPDSPPPR